MKKDVAAAHFQCRSCPDSNYTVSVNASVCTLSRAELAAQINPRIISLERRPSKGGSYQCRGDLSDKSPCPCEESM